MDPKLDLLGKDQFKSSQHFVSNKSQLALNLFHLKWFALIPASAKGECYQDSSDRIFPHSKNLEDKNGVVSCMEHCMVEGYKYIGLQYGSQCFCGNVVPPLSRRVPTNRCNTPCPGEAKENCGASWMMNVYETGKIYVKGSQEDCSI